MMTSRSDIVRAAYAESQLALAQQHNAALARTLYAATVERDTLRAELEAARAALGAAWCGGTLAEGITRKYRWLESLIGDAEKSQ
jgi:hypothetical protein